MTSIHNIFNTWQGLSTSFLFSVKCMAWHSWLNSQHWIFLYPRQSNHRSPFSPWNTNKSFMSFDNNKHFTWLIYLNANILSKDSNVYFLIAVGFINYPMIPLSLSTNDNRLFVFSYPNNSLCTIHYDMLFVSFSKRNGKQIRHLSFFYILLFKSIPT